jgi:imidazolonepropionase-like amidohydrolase
MEALQTATSNPARYLGTERTMGSIAPGKVADLVMLDSDPVADIHATTKIAAVVLDGSISPARTSTISWTTWHR